MGQQAANECEDMRGAERERDRAHKIEGKRERERPDIDTEAVAATARDFSEDISVVVLSFVFASEASATRAEGQPLAARCASWAMRPRAGHPATSASRPRVLAVCSGSRAYVFACEVAGEIGSGMGKEINKGASVIFRR